MGLLDENPVRLPTPPPESPPPPPPAARRPPAKWWEVEDLDPVTAAFVAGRVHWRDKGWCSDFVVYVLNTHVLLSVCCAHPKHPMSRFRRLLMLLSSLCFASSCAWRSRDSTSRSSARRSASSLVSCRCGGTSFRC